MDRERTVLTLKIKIIKNTLISTKNEYQITESNLNHDLFTTGMGHITREQFDELLKENYNSKMQFGKGGRK